MSDKERRRSRATVWPRRRDEELGGLSTLMAKLVDAVVPLGADNNRARKEPAQAHINGNLALRRIEAEFENTSTQGTGGGVGH